MDVFWQVVRDGAPLLTLIVILVTLRGQRVTNANAARDKLEQARNEARMVLLRPEHPPSDGYGAVDTQVRILILEVAGPSPIVRVESALVREIGPGVENIDFPSMTTSAVLKHEAVHPLLSIDNWTYDEAVMWRVTWRDRFGFSWCARHSFATGTVDLLLINVAAGRIPITSPTRWQRFRNWVVPYDRWAPESRPGA